MEEIGKKILRSLLTKNCFSFKRKCERKRYQPVEKGKGLVLVSLFKLDFLRVSGLLRSFDSWCRTDNEDCAVTENRRLIVCCHFFVYPWVFELTSLCTFMVEDSDRGTGNKVARKERTSLQISQLYRAATGQALLTPPPLWSEMP